ncbi:MAG: hypothetical protein PHQ59_01590 [Candidatus Daviesbacteria bacterium]|nr:hypothetical protein [Candidatus Daviesbacteria bacterium]
MKIDDISLKIIPDSRGKDTIEVEFDDEGNKVFDSVPSGKSTGSNEVVVLPPSQEKEILSYIEPLIKEKDFQSLEEFDKFLIDLDNTSDKHKLGGNLMLALSIGFTKLLAKTQNKEIYQLIAEIANHKVERLPLCFFNVINGGLHAKDSLPYQEYMFVPQNELPSQNLNSVMLLLKELGEYIHQKYEHLRMGDEGGYEISEKDPEVGLKVLSEVMKRCNQVNAKISLDVAASSFYKDGLYLVGDKVQTKSQLLGTYQQIIDKYQMLSIEDPFDEKDETGFQEITAKVGKKVWIVGDDLTTTSPERIKIMEENKACNAVIIKPNQIGTVSEALEAVRLAKSYNWKVIVSHRSGETMDTFIADLAVGVGADGLKSGCPLQKERLVKYQRLIEIEKLISEKIPVNKS